MATPQKILDLSSLPEEARTEILDFYEFLSKKYSGSPQDVKIKRQKVERKDRRSDFLDVFGMWSEDDVREFDLSVKDFDKIDPEDWR